MDVLISKDGDVLIAMLNGRLDTNTSPATEDKLMGNVNDGESKLVIDFANTDYISSSGLRVVLKLAKATKKSQGALALCNANQQILEVLEISGFLALVSHFDNVKEAVNFANS